LQNGILGIKNTLLGSQNLTKQTLNLNSFSFRSICPLFFLIDQ